MKKFWVPYHVVDHGVCSDMVAMVDAETKYQAMLIVTGSYVEHDDYGNSVFSPQPVIAAYVDYEGIREFVDFSSNKKEEEKTDEYKLKKGEYRKVVDGKLCVVCLDKEDYLE
jgi:hypothetical protein